MYMANSDEEALLYIRKKEPSLIPAVQAAAFLSDAIPPLCPSIDVELIQIVVVKDGVRSLVDHSPFTPSEPRL